MTYIVIIDINIGHYIYTVHVKTPDARLIEPHPLQISPSPLQLLPSLPPVPLPCVTSMHLAAVNESITLQSIITIDEHEIISHNSNAVKKSR